jgi:hypothetical protein
MMYCEKDIYSYYYIVSYIAINTDTIYKYFIIYIYIYINLEIFKYIYIYMCYVVEITNTLKFNNF